MPNSPTAASPSSGKPAPTPHLRPGEAVAQQTAYEALFKRLQQVFDNATDSIVCIDRNWNCTFANRAAREILKADDLIGENLWTRFPHNAQEPFASNYRTAMDQQVPTEFEAYYPAPLDIWFKVSARPYDDGIIIFSSNITSRKRAENLRDATARQLQQVLGATTDGILVLDRNWNFTFANRQAIAMLHCGPLIGENLWKTFPNATDEAFQTHCRTTMEQRHSTEFEAFYDSPLNLWLCIAARPFEEGIILFVDDITSRKKAEARRDATSRQLEQVFSTTTDAILSVSRDWTFTFLNRCAQKLLSVKGDLIGRNLHEEFPTTQTGLYRGFYDRAMYDRIPGEFEEFYPQPLNLWLNIQCLPSDDGMVVFFRDITAVRATKQNLLDQQAVLAFVQQTARVANWDIDLVTGTMKFGDGSYPVFGVPCATIHSLEDFRKLVLPAHLERVQVATRKAIRTGIVTTVDFQVVTPNGATVWVEGRGIPVYDAAGVATHLRGMTTDITHRKQNEEQLAASEERYRVLADLNPQGIWMGDAAGNITYANQGFLDYIGFTIAEATEGTRWLEAFYQPDRARVLETWARSVTTGVEYDIEARMIRAADRAPRWWWLRALPVRDDRGNILHWLGVSMDIDDRKTADDKLRAEKEETERQRAELETVYQTAPIGLALFDPVDFRYLRLNQQQAEIVGLPREQVLGRTLTDVAPIRGLHEMFQQVASGHPVRNQILEGELPTRPGETRTWNVSYTPVYRSDGTIQAITAASLEVTNQKKAENALIQSEKLAAVGRLASSISHEINNPLEAITNLLYLVAQDDALQPELKGYVHMAQSELARVCQIVTQTLRFHRQAVRATHVTAQDLTAAVLNLYQGRLTNSGIRVEANYASTTRILCFENDIRQVLNNLIANAIDAMRPSGGGRLIVRAHDTTMATSEYPNGVRGVRISIADTGHGMPLHVQARLFEAFYTTKDLNGTGLGLWISAGIVARHNGRLTLRSSQHPIHHGTVFSLFLPIEDSPEATSAPPPTADSTLN